MANEIFTKTKRGNKLDYSTPVQSLQNVGKLTPQAIDFEESILGALMIDSDAINQEIGFLKAEMFYKESHQHIYNAIMELSTNIEEDSSIDLLTVSNRLRKNGRLEFIGGMHYLASLTNRVASSANIEYHARIVMEKYVLRGLISTCSDIIGKAYDETSDVITLYDKAEQDLFNLMESNFKRGSQELKHVVKKAHDLLLDMRNNPEDFHGVPSGIYEIDKELGGWQKSDLIILAGRPGMGKTAFVLSVARNAAIDFKRPIAFFSLEMSGIQLVTRLFAMETGIPAEKIIKCELSDLEWATLGNKIGRLNTDTLIIDDTPSLSIFDLRAKSRRLKKNHDIQMIIVDYLQLMQSGADGSKGNREQEISFISRSLKGLAKELNIPIIALSQLSRQVESRSGNKPQLSDLRESGAIEQDADLVTFVYRPEYYKLDTFEDGTPSMGYADFIVAKNRHGKTGDIRLRFQREFTKFSSAKNSDFTDNPNDGIYENSNFDSSVVHLESSINFDDAQSTEDFPY